MSKVINWTSTIPDSAQGRLGISGWEDFQRPTFPDDYIIEPTPHRDDLDNTHDHYHCPANKSWMKNRYTLYTPIDIHFRIDSEVWKQKKLKEIEDMKQIFGPALPPEMALAREHKLNEEEMNKQIEEYVIDQPDTRLKRLVEHTIVTKSIMDMF